MSALGPDALRAAIARGPLLLDAAMGTRLIARGLDLKRHDTSLWNLHRPEVVLDIHLSDLAAGANVLVTNTFTANRSHLARYHRSNEVEAVNRMAVSIAREAIGPREVFVLGSIGDTSSGESLMEQAKLLMAAGVDAILLETLHSYWTASFVLKLLFRTFNPPVILSVNTARNLDSPEDCEIPPGADVLAIGTNCLLGTRPTLSATERLASMFDLPLIAKPSAGLPSQPQEIPESFAAAVPRLIELGVRLLGGCCGTTEAHVAAMRKALDESQ